MLRASFFASLLLALSLSACSRTAVPPADAAPPAAAILPKIDGDFWTIAHNPDLGDAGAPGQQPVDFAIWRAADGTWQLWSCIRYTNVGGDTRLFYRWEGASLTTPDWKPMGIAMEADAAFGEQPGGLQAPHVIEVGGTYHMFYGAWDRIAHATSTDGKTFTRVLVGGSSVAFSDGPGSGSRDPMTLAIDGVFHLVYADSDGADYARTSTDLTTWSERTKIAYGGSAGTSLTSAECPFLVHRDDAGAFFLFRTQHYGPNRETRVYRSSDPNDFGLGDDGKLVVILPVAAAEIVTDGAQSYVATVRADYQGIEIAKLAWAP